MFSFFFSSWGLVLWLLWVVAIIHFIRHRPDMFWIFILIFGGWIGAIIYLAVEAWPTWRVNPEEFGWIARRRRLRKVKLDIIDNPSAANFDELGDLLLEDGDFAQAREIYSRSIAARNDSIHPFYKRGQCALALGDYAAAIADLELVLTKDPKHDFMRAPGYLAQAYAMAGDSVHAEKVFEWATRGSCSTETTYNYAMLLTQLGKKQEARELLEPVVRRRETIPGYLKKTEGSWLRKCETLLRRL